MKRRPPPRVKAHEEFQEEVLEIVEEWEEEAAPRLPSRFWHHMTTLAMLAVGIGVIVAIAVIGYDHGKRSESARPRLEDSRPASAIQPSAWDGSVAQVKNWIRARAKDPTSVKYHEWKNVTKDGKHITTVDCTMTNGFGGPSRSRLMFLLDAGSGAIEEIADMDTGKMIQP